MNSTPHEDFNYYFCEYKLQHEILTEEILNVVECEKIFLLATTTTSQHVANLFLTPSISPKLISHYHVLVVVPRAGKSPNMETQDKIEGKLQSFSPITAIVLDTDQFSNWIKERHPFAIALVKGRSPLYDSKENAIENSDTYDNREPQIKFESRFAHGRNKSQEFLAAADLFRIREQNKMAAFMLHQSLEQILRSLLIITTGLQITTHNLDKLLRFCSMFYGRFPEIFKSHDGKSQKAFQLLQKAYIDGRYKDDYHIGTSDLIFLQEKIHTVLNFYEHITKEFLKQLEERLFDIIE
jgi:uncharacterized protein